MTTARKSSPPSHPREMPPRRSAGLVVGGLLVQGLGNVLWFSGYMSSLTGDDSGSAAIGGLLSVVGTVVLLFGIYNALQNLEEVHRMVTRRYFTSGDAAEARADEATGPRPGGPPTP